METLGPRTDNAPSFRYISLFFFIVGVVGVGILASGVYVGFTSELGFEDQFNKELTAGGIIAAGLGFSVHRYTERHRAAYRGKAE